MTRWPAEPSDARRATPPTLAARRRPAALDGNLASRRRQARAAEQAVRPRPAGPPPRPRLVRRGRAAGQRLGRPTSPPTAWSPAWAGSTGGPWCVVANDPTVKAGSWGARTVEKMVRLTEYALRARAADLLAGRLRRRSHHRPGRAVPGSPRRRPDLLQPGAAVGPRAPDLLPVRAVGGRRRLHPELLRHRDHGRGQRLDVPGLAPHGRDGDRRASPRSRRWAAPACTPPCRAAATTWPSTTPTPSTRPRPGSRYFPQTWRDEPPRYARRRPGPAVHRRPGARHREARLRHARGHRRARRRRELLRDQAAVRHRSWSCGLGLLDGRPVGIVANNPMAKGGVLFVDSADKAARFIWCCDAFNIPLVFLADVPGLHGRHPGRGAGHHPPRRQDGHRRVRGDRARRCASSCARPTAPGSTPWPARPSSPRPPSPCRRPRSR